MKDRPTELRFTGEISKVQLGGHKKDYSGLHGGGMDILLHVETPEAPGKPQEPWQLREREEPSPQRKKGEAETTFSARQQKWEKAHENRQKAKTEYEQEIAKYRQALEVAISQRVSYAALVGLASLLAGQQVEVTLVATQQDLLPGFPDLLALTSGDHKPEVLASV